MRIPAHVSIAVNQIPVRCDMKSGNVVETKWHGIRNLGDHGEMCRAFGLDPVRHYFDLPSSFRGTGRNSTGASGRNTNLTVSGLVFRHGEDGPVGKVTVIREGDRFRDHDPESDQDFYRHI